MVAEASKLAMTSKLCGLICGLTILLTNIVSVGGQETYRDVLSTLTRNAVGQQLVDRLGLEKPMDVGDMDLKMLIYSAENPVHPFVVPLPGNVDLKRLPVNWLLETKIIVHGLFTSVETSWVQEMKNSLIEHYECNVGILDWRKAANLNALSKLEANAVVVGKVSANFFKQLFNQTTAEDKMVHIIGHSIGGHLAGVAGRHLNGTIGRITGLDPSYLATKNLEPDLLLRREDAVFVDIVHTNLALTGTAKVTGDVEFFPNGGETFPSCKKAEAGNDSFRHFVNRINNFDENLCSHYMAHDVFTATFGLEPVHLMATPCVSYESYKRGDCQLNDSSSAVFGMLAQKPRKSSREPSRFYFDTADKSPFFNV